MRVSRPAAERDILAANDAFYTAFRSRDLAAMEELWSRERTIACAHPGWGILVGRERVMASWKAILGTEGEGSVRYSSPTVVLATAEAGVITLVEHVDEVQLAATNIFALEEGIWRLVLHQAGAIAGSVTAGAGASGEDEIN